MDETSTICCSEPKRSETSLPRPWASAIRTDNLLGFDGIGREYEMGRLIKFDASTPFIWWGLMQRSLERNVSLLKICGKQSNLVGTGWGRALVGCINRRQQWSSSRKLNGLHEYHWIDPTGRLGWEPSSYNATLKLKGMKSTIRSY